MAEDKSLDKLMAMRNLLKAEMENSEALSSALNKTGSKLEEIKRQLLSFEVDARRERWRLSLLPDRIHHVIAPAAAVLRAFASVSELEKSLLSSDPSSDLPNYISITKRLGEALRFLSSSCNLAAKWLEDIVELLAEDGIPDNHLYVLRFKKPMRILHDLLTSEAQAHPNGGILGTAFEKLDKEFKRILEDGDGLPSREQDCLGQVLPVTNLRKLQAIIQTLHAHNHKLTDCLSVYIEVRASVIRKCFEALGTSYLEKPITVLDNVQDIEGHIEQWRRHVEMAVKDVYEFEHRLCYQVFETAGADVSSSCFGKIATDSGILHLLAFGLRVSECKKDPVKLLKLLDVFSTMDNVRVQYNRLFGGEPCAEIREVTRKLIRRLVNCVSEIFWELPYQVELQRPNAPPLDGSVPRLVSFVTEYCEQLLGSHYRPILTKILEINLSWKNEKYHEELLAGHIYNILKEIALNLDTWSRSYKDITLSCIFMMNNHCHFGGLKETHLGAMMGDSWLRAHEQYRDYYGALYVKESWGKLLPILSCKAQVVPASPVKRQRARESIKRTLHAFAEAFDEIYMKQSNWVVEDEKLRWKICQVAVQAVVPVYESYLQSSIMLLVEEDSSGPGKHLKHTSKGLESKLKTMLQNKKQGSYKSSHFVQKVMDSDIFPNNRWTLTAI